MLPSATVPAGLWEVLGACRAVFTAPTFLTFALLVTGAWGAVEPRTVTGMWTAAGMAGRAHWSRAHRFLSHATGAACSARRGSMMGPRRAATGSAAGTVS